MFINACRGKNFETGPIRLHHTGYDYWGSPCPLGKTATKRGQRISPYPLKNAFCFGSGEATFEEEKKFYINTVKCKRCKIYNFQKKTYRPTDILTYGQSDSERSFASKNSR